MNKYPESPAELVQSAVQEALRKGGNPGYVDPVLALFQNALNSLARGDQKTANIQFQQAQASVDDAVRRNPAVANLRTKYSWARQWALGRLPGTMAADNQVWSSGDLGGDSEKPDDDYLKQAWMSVISNGQWSPPAPAEPDPKPQGGSFSMEVPDPGAPAESAQPTSAQTGVPAEQEGTKDQAEVKISDNYSDIQEAIDKGIL